MAGIRARARQALTPVSGILRAHLRTLLPVGGVVVAGLLAFALLAGVYAQVIGVTVYQAMVDSVSSIESWTVVAALILTPLILLAILAALIWAGTVVHAANSVISKTRASMPSAAWVSLRRSPRALAVIVITAGAAIGAIIAAPVFLIVGVAGLLAKRGRRELPIPMAIPFGVAVLVLVRWSLALPAVWLDGLAPRAALRESSSRVRGRGPAVGVLLVAAVLVTVGLTEGAAALAGPDPIIQLIVRVVALVVIGALPFVALTVLYRHGASERPAVLPKPISRRGRLAVAVALSLVLPLAVSGTVAPPANAAAGSTVALTVFDAETLTTRDFALQVVVTGTAPTGTVTFAAVPDAGGAPIDLGPLTLSGGTGFGFVGAALPAGEYDIVAHYGGDVNNPAADSPAVAHKMTDAAVTIGVSSTTPTTGDNTTLTIALTPVTPAVDLPTGTVTISGGGHTFGPLTLDAFAMATQAVDMATFTSRELTVSYSGGSIYPPSATLYTVPRIPTTTTVNSASFVSATYGDLQTYTGAVAGTTGTTPTGTVQLYWNNLVVASAPVVAGGFSISTNAMRAMTAPLYLGYTGDASHAPSDNTGSPIHLEVDKADSVPVVTIASSAPRIGTKTQLTATIADLGTGPIGQVTFLTTTGTVLGFGTPVNGVVTIDYTPTQLVTFVKASFAGDINFEARGSANLRVDASQAQVDVEILSPGTVSLGDVFDLSATVSVGGGALVPDHGVDFASSTGTIIATAVPVVAGTATISACAGDAVDCPAGTKPLGRNDLDIVASYTASSLNLLGESDPYLYEPGKAVTATSLVVNPTTVIFGSAVFLTATVTVPGSSATPTGHVSFYGVEPVPGGPGALAFLGNAPLVGGVARFETQSGDGIDDLRWPADSIRAIYFAEGALFKASSATVATSLGRVGVTVDLYATVGAAGTPSKVTVSLSHDPGASADYTGRIVVTADNSSTCSFFLAAGERVHNCFITWSTVGAHTLSATYAGDLVFLPGASGIVNVNTTRPTPSLGSTLSTTSVLVDTDVVVTWNQFDPTATGTVTVWGDGTKWCEVDVQDLTCTGRFGIASATGSLVDVVIQYSGDPDWFQLQQTRQVRVTRCAVLDVRGNDASLGTVRVDTAPNCGASGYLPGTIVQVTATPKSPAEFGSWLGYRPPAPNLVLVASTATDRFVVTTDTQTWVHVAQFRVPCNSVTASVTDGLGGISVYPASNCTTSSGAAGYLYGTKVTIYPDGRFNSYYDEPDTFWAFGILPFGAVRGSDSAGHPVMRLTVNAPAVIPVAFGPVCRTVTVVFAPATTGDAADLSPAADCLAPSGQGYLRGTEVTVHATSGDPTLAISGWSINGVAAPQLDPADDPVVVIDRVAPVLTATTVHCYAVDVTIDGVPDRFGEPTGEVRIDGAACPDGSDRYLGGTKVTIVPRILSAGTLFNGWNATRISPLAPDTGETGDVTAGAMVIATLDRDVHVSAGFFQKNACSRLTDAGAPGLLSFEFSGCGPGYYLDTRKQQAALENVPAESLSSSKLFSTLRVDVDQSGPLGVYVTIDGDTPDCNGALDREGFENLGLVTASRLNCLAGGDIVIQADVCQPVLTYPEFTVKGREGTTYGAESMPGTFYVSGADGIVSEVSGFLWAQAMPVKPVGDQFAEGLAPAGPCGATANLFAPNTDVLLYAGAPSSGFAFDGWTGFGNAEPILPSPMHRLTNGYDTALSTGAAYTVTCHTVTLGPGIHLDGAVPRCPGSSEADNSFIAGTAIKIRADYSLGDKSIVKFTSGVVSDQIYEDPATLDLMTYAYVDSDKNVSALYQNSTQRIGTGLAETLKIAAGIVAIIAPVIIGMLFPPVGIFFGIVGVAAGIAGFIPGADKAAAVFDLVNPTKISSCIARWGFNKPGSPSGQNIGAMISTGKTAATMVFTSKDVLIRNIGGVGIAGAGLAIGYGLYDAGIGGANLVEPQSLEELADRSTITGCLDQQWRILGSNLSGTQGSSPANGAQQQHDAEPQPTGVSVPPAPTPVLAP